MSSFKMFFRIIALLSVVHCAFVTSECPSGFVRHGNSCYHFSHDTETWFDALVACREMYGAYIAEIDDASEGNFIKNEVEIRTPTSGTAGFWIGGNDLQIEGEWKWKTSGRNITRAEWGNGYPNNSGGDENCLEIADFDGISGPQEVLWNDLACHVTIQYICEREL